MKNKFYVNLRCKPYVRQFLVNEFGEPANLQNNQYLYTRFIKCLGNKNHHYDQKIKDELSNYSEDIDIVINEVIFYRHGWELTKTDVYEFGKYIELYIKLEMRIYIGGLLSKGTWLLKDAIKDYQDEFNFTETMWPSESIKKDFYRNGFIDRSLIEKIKQSDKKIVLSNLSLVRTQLKMNYELNFETSN